VQEEKKENSNKLAASRSTTVHASKAGIAGVSFLYEELGWREGRQTAELVAFGTQGPQTMFTRSEFYKTLLMDIDNPESAEWEESIHQEAQRIGNMQAFGVDTNFRELAEANISYDVRGNERPFRDEKLSWWAADGSLVNVTLPGELRGEHVLEGPDPDSLLEPLAVEEAESFIDIIVGRREVWEETLSIQGVVGAQQCLQVMLTSSVEHAEETIQAVSEHNDVQIRRGKETLSPWKVLGIDADFFSRARASAKRCNVGGMWSMCGAWFIGEREGTTVGLEAQNDLLYTKFEQHHQPGERIDGKLLFSEEMLQAAQERCFDQLFDVKKKAADGGPANRGWAAHNLYLWRQSHTRGELFAEKLWKVLTWPLEWVEEGMNLTRREYREDTRRNAPGPGRAYADWKWQNTPLVGTEAIEWMRLRGRGTMAGKPVSPKVRVFKGEEWHKNILNKEHLAALEEAYALRLRLAASEYGEDEEGYEGLPPEHVVRCMG